MVQNKNKTSETKQLSVFGEMDSKRNFNLVEFNLVTFKMYGSTTFEDFT